MEGILELGFNTPVLLTQIIQFFILFGLLYLVAYKPIMRMMDERSQRIKESLDQAESVKLQASRAEEDVRKQLETASREGQERIARAVRMGEEIKQKSQEDARREAEALITRARNEIQQERDEAINAVKSEFADLTIMAASKVIDRDLDKEKHKQLIEKVLEESSTLNKG
jgi:F-type H+-transporting ATPase subunit b